MEESSSNLFDSTDGLSPTTPYLPREDDDLDSVVTSNSSLPDSAISDDIGDDLFDAAPAPRFSDAEREWHESLQQLELMLTMLLVPYLGKYFGRRFAFYSWARFMEWKYPVKVVLSSPRTFKAAGLLEAATL